MLRKPFLIFNHPVRCDRKFSNISDDRITITFTHMDVEEYADCGKDYVRVLNGDDPDAPEIGKYCGRTIPSPITSSGSAMVIQFVSDNTVQLSGFRVMYTKSLSSKCNN